MAAFLQLVEELSGSWVSRLELDKPRGIFHGVRDGSAVTADGRQAEKQLPFTRVALVRLFQDGERAAGLAARVESHTIDIATSRPSFVSSAL